MGSEFVTDLGVLEALALLRECLSDDEPWLEGDLVSRMEDVYMALGGDLRDCS